jgi:hypothetical protein
MRRQPWQAENGWIILGASKALPAAHASPLLLPAVRGWQTLSALPPEASQSLQRIHRPALREMFRRASFCGMLRLPAGPRLPGDRCVELFAHSPRSDSPDCLRRAHVRTDTLYRDALGFGLAWTKAFRFRRTGRSRGNRGTRWVLPAACHWRIRLERFTHLHYNSGLWPGQRA